MLAVDPADNLTRTQDLPSRIKGFGVKSVVADERQNCFVFVQDAESGDVYLNDTQCDTDQAVVCELEVARQGKVSEDSLCWIMFPIRLLCNQGSQGAPSVAIRPAELQGRPLGRARFEEAEVRRGVQPQRAEMRRNQVRSLTFKTINISISE